MRWPGKAAPLISLRSPRPFWRSLFLATILALAGWACTGTTGTAPTTQPASIIVPTPTTVTPPTTTVLSASTTVPEAPPAGPPFLFGKSVPGGGDEIFLAFWDGTIGENLTNNPADDHRGEISPDGKTMVFGSDRDGSTNLYLMDLDSREVTRLTNNPAEDWGPVWSPDGSRVAFYRAGPGIVPIVYVIDADGTNEGDVTDGVVPANAVDWSGDGEWLLVWMVHDGALDIFRVHPDGSNLTPVTSTPGSEGPGAVSPDGSMIAFSYAEPGGGKRDIWVMGVDGSDRRQLTDGPTEDWTTEPVWSPDGMLVIYQSGVRGDYYVVGLDGSARRKLFDAP